MAQTKKRRALFLFPTDVMGGAENVTRLAANAALDSGFFEEIICFVLCKPPTGSLETLACDPRVQLVYSGAGSEKGGLAALAKAFVGKRYDLVFSSHTHLNAAASLFRKLGLLKTRRLVARESTMIFERDMGWRGLVARKLYRLYGAQDLIICQTKRMADSLNHHTGNRLSRLVAHVPNPIDFLAISEARDDECLSMPNLPHDKELIAWCGRLAPVKSPLRAIDTLDRLVRAGNDHVHLVMMGEGQMRDEILAHAMARGLGSYLTMTGRVAKPAAIMKHCRAGLMTSDVEGFPNVILEMLAAGVDHVVTTDCAGGLDAIPGVVVAGEKSAESLASNLSDTLREAQDKEQIETFLKQRSPDMFFEKILTA